MDTLAKLWDVETGAELANLSGHTGEIIAIQFAPNGVGSLDPYTSGVTGTLTGPILLTGSFDHTVCLWDIRTGHRVFQFNGHSAEISAAVFNYNTTLVASSSMDKTVRVNNKN